MVRRENRTATDDGEVAGDAVSVGADGGALLAAELEGLAVVDRGNYAVGEELARGGMGKILLATDLRHGRPVAIKMLLNLTPTSVKRFVREARATARLQHPAIMPVYEAGRWPSGEPFLVMKRVEGASLSSTIEEKPTLAERLSLLPQLTTVTEAIAYAHSRGVIHRDLKPSNILVGQYGEVLVIDWGLAKDVGEPEPLEPGTASGPSGQLTVAGSVLGTPRYMSPEQASGGVVTPATDVYSLGAVLYHTLAGHAPYEDARDDSVKEQVLAGAPAPLDPTVPADLRTIVSDEDLVAASTAGEVSVWRVGSGERVGRLAAVTRQATGSLAFLVFDPGGQRLLVPGVDGGVRIFEPRLGEVTTTFDPRHNQALRAAFSADGEWLAIHQGDLSIRIAHARTGDEVHVIMGGEGTFSFSPDGPLLMTIGEDARAALWDMSLDDRPLEEIERYVECRAGYRLEGDRLVPGRGDSCAH